MGGTCARRLLERVGAAGGGRKRGGGAVESEERVEEEMEEGGGGDREEVGSERLSSAERRSDFDVEEILFQPERAYQPL